MDNMEYILDYFRVTKQSYLQVLTRTNSPELQKLDVNGSDLLQQLFDQYSIPYTQDKQNKVL